MLEFRIDDPEIEKVYHSPDEIINLLKSIVNKEVEIIRLKNQNILEDSKIREILTAYFQDKPVLKVYLFGSYARKEATIHSDIDILVDLDYSAKIGTLFYRMSDELEGLLGKKIDLLSSQAITEQIKEKVLQERILIYERKNQ